MKPYFILSLLLFVFIPYLNAQIELAGIFTDDMVLQCDIEIPVWGWSSKGQIITLTFNGNTYQTKTNKKGKWQVQLPATPAGGTYQMTITDGVTKKTLNNILFGDVWICSGQSNMEWTVDNSMFAQNEIMNAKDQQIRHFKVARHTSTVPTEKLEGSGWEVSSPETVGKFTAVGYQFAKSIRQHHQVPIGLLNTSWGGSRIEPWMSAESLGYNNFPKTAKAAQKKSDKVAKVKMAAFEAKFGQLPKKDMGLVNGEALWAAPELDDSQWKSMNIPNLWENQGLASVDGIVWFRKTIELSAKDIEQDITLHLSKIDDNDKTYFNGQLIGETNQYSAERVYQVPSKLLKIGTNVIVVRVEDTGGGGGFYGDSEGMYCETNHQKIPLAGAWKYKLGVIQLNTSKAPNQEPVIIYNKMIYPILDFPIKGVIWYQGESNATAEDAYSYRNLFTTMIQDWRNRWGVGDFPFLYVQLANYMATKSQPSSSNWAILRESQSKALEVNNTAQAVIIDIGDADDIHPRNKHDVGYRLALGARKLAYGEQDLMHTGPVYQSMKIEGNKIRLQFSTSGGELVAKGNTLKEFAIAGNDKKFVWANAKIEGNEIIVWSDEVQNPVAVRYAWADNPHQANLYNEHGLPASPFRTDSW